VVLAGFGRGAGGDGRQNSGGFGESAGSGFGASSSMEPRYVGNYLLICCADKLLFVF